MQKYKKSTEFFVCFGPVVCYNNQLGKKKKKWFPYPKSLSVPHVILYKFSSPVRNLF